MRKDLILAGFGPSPETLIEVVEFLKHMSFCSECPEHNDEAEALLSKLNA